MSKKYHWQNEAKTYFNNLPSPNIWFEFLGWITATASLDYLSKKTKSPIINTLYLLTIAVLWNFLQKTMFSSKFQDYFPKTINNGVKKILTYVLTILLIIIIWLVVEVIIHDLSNTFNI